MSPNVKQSLGSGVSLSAVTRMAMVTRGGSHLPQLGLKKHTSARQGPGQPLCSERPGLPYKRCCLLLSMFAFILFKFQHDFYARDTGCHKQAVLFPLLTPVIYWLALV